MNELDVMILIDTRAELSLISERTYKQMKTCNETNVSISMLGVGGASVTSKLSVPIKLFLLIIDDIEYAHSMLVVPDNSIRYEAILDFDFLQNTRFTWKN